MGYQNRYFDTVYNAIGWEWEWDVPERSVFGAKGPVRKDQSAVSSCPWNTIL
jgi:hypothetical protein